MAQARTERVKNPEADKVLAARIVPGRDPAADAVAAAGERAAGKVKARVKVKVKAADKDRAAAAVAGDAIKIVSTAGTDRFYASPSEQLPYLATAAPSFKPQTRRIQSCQDLTEADPWAQAP